MAQQVRVGWRSYVSQVTTSSLLTSIYGVWNGDTSTTTLGTSVFSAWNGENTNNVTVKNAWNANGNAIDSKSGANGTIATPSGTGFTAGSMTFGSGKLGSGAFTFDGTNFINLPDNTLSFTGDFSISCWFYVPANYVANGSLVSAFDNKSSYPTYYGWNFWYDSTNKNIGFSVSNPLGGQYASVVLSTPNNSIVPGQWNHVVVTRKISTRSRIYINGVLSASNTSTVNPTYYFGLAYIGASYYSFSQPYYNKPNAGLKIDSIYTFEAELDATAVSELYNSGTGQEYPFTVSNALIASPTDLVSTNHGTVMNGCTFTTGLIGQAFTFDGVNDYVSLPNNSLNFTGDFSISAWVMIPSTPSSGQIRIFSNDNYDVATSYGYALYINTNKTIGFYVGSSVGTSNVTSTTVMSLNTWYHITIKRDATAKRSDLYINGVFEAQATNTNLTISYGTRAIQPTIGAYRGNNQGVLSTSNYMINGSKIDGLTIWNRKLTDDEVTQLYNIGSGIQYPFTNAIVASAKNSFGIDNGTLMNGCSITDGKIGNAFTFDGVNDYVALPDNSLNFIGDFSFSFWIYNDNMSLGLNRRYIGSCYYSGSGTYGYGWTLSRRPDNNYHFQLSNGDSNANSLFTTSIDLIPINQWTHISVTRKKSTQTKIYKNGVDVTSNFTYTLGNNTVDCGYNTTQYCTIGALKDNNTSVFGYISGKMDGINVWQKELTQAEVTELYNSGTGKQLTVSTPIVTYGLLFNYDINRISSYPATDTVFPGIFYDTSGNNNNMTLMSYLSSVVLPTDGTGALNNIGYIRNGIKGFVFNYPGAGSNGLSNYGKVPLSTTIDANGYTFGGWVKNVSGAGTAFTKGCDTLYGGWSLALYFGGGTIQLSIINASSQGVSVSGSYASTIDQWYYITGQYIHGSGLKVFVNGQLVNSMIQGATAISLRNSPGWTIAKPSTTAQRCVISTYHAYNRVLTDAEILQNYNATKSGFGY